MKKLTPYAMAAFLMLSVIPMQLNATPGITPVSVPATVPVGSAEVEVLTA